MKQSTKNKICTNKSFSFEKAAIKKNYLRENLNFTSKDLLQIRILHFVLFFFIGNNNSVVVVESMKVLKPIFKIDDSDKPQ